MPSTKYFKVTVQIELEVNTVDDAPQREGGLGRSAESKAVQIALDKIDAKLGEIASVNLTKVR